MAPDIEPKRKVWTIGGREFAQEPLGLGRTSAVIGLLGTALSVIAGNRDAMERLAGIDTERATESLPDVIYLLGTVLRESPGLINEFVAICLDVTENPQDTSFVLRHAPPRLGLAVAREFAAQNDIKGLWQDFLELRSLFGTPEAPPSSNASGAGTAATP